MPARKFKRKAVKRNRIKIYLYILLLALFVTAVYIWFSNTGVWDGKRLIVVAYPNKSDTSVLIVNSEKEELYKIDIPNDTQVNSVGNRGVWKLGSLWKLGYDQQVGGDLVVKTIVKNLNIPTYAWGSEKFEYFYSGNAFFLISSILFSGKTNLGLVERFKLAKISAGIKDINKYHIKLAETEFLSAKELRDGTRGYIITQNFPKRLLPITSMFMDEKAVTVSIINLSDRMYDVDGLASAIESMGAKVISTKPSSNDFQSETDCIVEGPYELTVNITKVFGCSLSKEKVQGGSDLVMYFGDKFIERF